MGAPASFVLSFHVPLGPQEADIPALVSGAGRWGSEKQSPARYQCWTPSHFQGCFPRRTARAQSGGGQEPATTSIPTYSRPARIPDGPASTHTMLAASGPLLTSLSAIRVDSLS